MQKGLKKICLITPSHIASNPRLVKEAASLSENGYAVHLIFTQNLSWLARHDERILSQNPGWTYDVLNVNRSKTGRKFRTLLQKTLPLFTRFFPLWKNILLNRHFNWQLRRAMQTKADLYIAHNLGALPVAVLAAKKTGAKSGFDAEDFHRHETSDDAAHPDVRLKIHLEEKYLPKTAYITAASPMIAEHYEKIVDKPVTCILNVFNQVNEAKIKPSMPNNPLRIFWFSQTIGPNRGLEMAIDAINSLSKHSIELHLLGSPQADFVTRLLKQAEHFHHHNHSIDMHTPVSQDEVFRFTATFDIGLASETGFSINNNIALSNKLFTYIQCGLAVLASDTPAQKAFMNQHPQTGKTYIKEDPASLAKAISFYAENRDELLEAKSFNFQLGQDLLNWETESRKFLPIINGLIS